MAPYRLSLRSLLSLRVQSDPFQAALWARCPLLFLLSLLSLRVQSDPFQAAPSAPFLPPSPSRPVAD